MEFALPFYLVIKRQIVWSLESHNYLVLEKISRDRQEVASTYGIKPRLSFTTSVNFFSHINWWEEVMMSSSRKHDQQKWGRQQKSIRQTDNLKKKCLKKQHSPHFIVHSTKSNFVFRFKNKIKSVPLINNTKLIFQLKLIGWKFEALEFIL